jgi:hypothetical protein
MLIQKVVRYDSIVAPKTPLADFCNNIRRITDIGEEIPVNEYTA